MSTAKKKTAKKTTRKKAPAKKKTKRKKAKPRTIVEDLTQKGTKRKSGPDGGRPPAPIDWKSVKAMCAIQCTQKEICAVVGVTDDTMRIRVQQDQGMEWKEFYEAHSAGGKASLRRWQYDNAKKGNATMQIWLGKNWLGQSDKMEAKVVKSFPWDKVLEGMSDEELDLIESIQAKMDAANADVSET